MTGLLELSFWIVTRAWEQKKAPFFFAPDAFCMWTMEKNHVSLFLCIALHMQLKPWLILLFHCVCTCLFMSTSPAFWAVICVHNNKPVRDKELRLRVGSTFCFSAFHYSTEAWGWLTTAYTETGIRFYKPRLYCIDPQLLYWFILRLHVWMPNNQIKEISAFYGCPDLSPLQLVAWDLRSPVCSVRSHSSFHSFSMRLWMAAFWVNLCCSFSFDAISSSTILPFFSSSPAFMPLHIYSGELCLMEAERRQCYIIIWNSNMTWGCLRIF